MDSFNFVLLYCIVDVFSTYCIYRLIRIFLGPQRFGNIKTFLFYILFYISDIIFYILIGYPILIFIQKIIILLLLTYLYNGFFIKKIFTVVSVYLFILITETIIVLLTGYLNHSLFVSTEYESVLGITSMPIIQIMIILILEHYSNIKSKEEVSLLYFFAIIFVPLASVAMIIYILEDGNAPINHLIIVLTYILAINFTIFYLYDGLIKTEKYKLRIQLIEEKVVLYKKQLEIMDVSRNAFSAVRHDLINHSIMLSGLISENNTEGALRYLDNVLDKINFPSIVETGRADIDSILNFKIFQAKQYNIKIVYEITIPTELAIEDYDMVVIMGNLLDNAIEAVKKLTFEKRIIQMRIRYDRFRLSIQTKNSFDGNYIADKSGNLQTTNQCTGEKHGIGILNIKKTISNYNGSFRYKIDENAYFKTNILLYVNERQILKDTVLK